MATDGRNNPSALQLAREPNGFGMTVVMAQDVAPEGNWLQADRFGVAPQGDVTFMSFP